MITISLSFEQLQGLDLSPIAPLVEAWQTAGIIDQYENQVQFQIDFPRSPDDPRELSEIPEVRLWFVRLDSIYPWFPFLLDWKAGEFVRYAAMLVPHQFHRQEGIQFNPEALELFMMQKVFSLADWLKMQGIDSHYRVKYMAQLLGYELEDTFLKII
ncbi:MAG: CRR6 family NdhI maturation factor [Microcystaceae cyanobacterium]